MLHRRTVQSLVAVLALIAMLCQGTSVLAGTTGTLTGTAIESTTHQPIAGAKITAASSSQTATVTADASGRFTFIALAPDTYTVSVDANGYQSTSLAGITVNADQTRSISLTTVKTLRTIARVASRAATSLVKPGTTADVYSVDATQQSKFSGVGGGAEQNQAYSAIATVPGAYVPQGVQDGNGIGAALYIRGGDYDQVGFEIDGVPVNRSFDNYPSGPAATLGQQELQVYTGAAPADAEAQGLAGFINQVIKIGSYPFFVNGSTSVGGPAFYHQGSVEVGGATQNRRFSYFLGTNAYNQEFRYADQFQGASLSNTFGTPLNYCTPTAPGNTQTPSSTPSCFSSSGQNYADGVPASTPTYALGPYQAFSTGQIKDRDDVLNLHYYLPHRDGTRDDIQLLGVENFVTTQYYDSTNDQGGAGLLNASGVGIPVFINGYQYNGPVGTLLPTNYQSLTSLYFYPKLQSPQGAAAAVIANGGPFPGQTIPFDLRDAISNDQGIIKLGYTKSLGANALFKVYGYSFYSDWLQLGPQSSFANITAATSADYELSSHTRGVSGTFSDQLNPQNLLEVQGSYTTAQSTRDNNTQFFNGLYGPHSVNSRTAIGVLVDSSNPYNGICYTPTATPTTCAYGRNDKNPIYAQFATLAQAYTGTIAPAPASMCGSGPCQYLVVDNGIHATYNRVVPKFTSASITDQIRPNDRLSINVGMRLDVFQFQGSNTATSPARTFWYNAFNLDNCLDAQNNLADKVRDLGLASPTASCPTNYRAANFVNPSGLVTQTYPQFQPRLGFTYNLNPSTVVRASYGRYAQAPNSAFEQYDALQQNAPALLYGTFGFQKFGFNTPDHPIRPEVSNNYDLSFEKSFGDTAIKISPFYRSTQDQIQQFYLNQQTSFVSGLNVGAQTAKGVEFELDKGNFGRDGIATKLSFTYTNSYIRYNTLSNGSSIIDPFNAAVQQYNGYTSYCAGHPTDKACGATQSGIAAAPCYTAATATVPSAPVASGAACTAADIANPYWNAPIQGLFDPNANQYTYDIFPAGIGSSVSGYGAPYFATLVAQYKHGPLSIIPNVQFAAGSRYGAPESTFGVAPDTCGGTVAASAAGDPRYKYGSPGGGAFDALSCGTLAGGIPDRYTGKFDSIGQFAAPSTLQFGTQMQYDFSKKFSLVANFSNIVNACFGGTKTGFTHPGACGYGVIGAGTGGDVGNTYNPGAAIQPYINSPYLPFFAGYPFSVTVSAKLHI